MRVHRGRFGRCGVLLAVVLLTGCAGTIDGTGRADSAPSAGGSSTPSDDTSSTPSDDTSSTPSDDTSTSDPTDDSGGSADRTALDCQGANVVAPAGQPFCFDLPDGFRQDDVNIDSEAGSSASYTTGALLTERDVIIFSVYPLNIDSDELTDQELTDALAPVIDGLAAQGFSWDSTEPQISEVDGARAYFYSGSDSTGLVVETNFLFRGATELQVNCQWQSMEVELLAGCEQVLGSVQVIG